MFDKKYLHKITDYCFEIPKSYRSDMNVSARIYSTEEMIEKIVKDRSLEQLVNVSTLPGIIEHALVMPDVHEGYGFPIGGVCATAYPDGAISPGGIGYDINCGVRLLKTQLTLKDFKNNREILAKELYRAIPSGVGRGGKIKLSVGELDKVLEKGLKWAVEKGYMNEQDRTYVESNGQLNTADAKTVSDRAKSRGRDQIGTMGAGNHFIEIDEVENIFDQDTAKQFGLQVGQIVILIHTGSRGLGHQVATDYIRQMVTELSKYSYTLPDRELACAPFSSQLGKNYFAAMSAAANFAWCNRQLITYLVQGVINSLFSEKSSTLTLLYDVAHNIAKIEKYNIGGRSTKVIVHRKGATRAFPGQPVIIPGSMGTASYILVGAEESLKQTFGSSCHGAGRQMSRTQARREVNTSVLRKRLKDKNIYIQTGSDKGFCEEAPQAYKDIESVVDVVHKARIARKVARFIPRVVIKG